jgi:subtilisin family serine protease
MKQSTEMDDGRGEETFQPIEEFLKKPYDPILYPNLIEDYHKLSDKDIHLAELYRLAATTQDDRLLPSPVQAVRLEGQLWVDVLVEVKKDTSLKQLYEIMQVHNYSHAFISGRILAQNLPKLNEHALRMQAARPTRPTLDDSIKDIRAGQNTLTNGLNLSIGQLPPNGKDVIVGIVDFGCDFLHPNFLDDQKNTRIKFFWDQMGSPQTAGLPFGREYDQSFINQAIHNGLSYNDLDYKPATNAHGTHVMDIAAGNSSKYPGVAPGADLIFVHLGWPSPIQTEEEFLGSSKYLYDAVKYIFDKASQMNKPAVVNVSLATNGGPHDGTSMVEAMFDDLLSGQPGRAIVIAAGNSFLRGIHTSGLVKPGLASKFEWNILCHVPAKWEQRQELEIWYESQVALVLDVYAPNGTFSGSCEMEGTFAKSENDFPEPVILIHHNFNEEADENHINIFIDDRYQKLELGKYRFELKLPPGTLAGNIEYHAWIEENKDYPSEFADEYKVQQYTTNSIANGRLPISVGAYNPDREEKNLLAASGSGPSRNKGSLDIPTLSAPGGEISAARSYHYEEGDRTSKSGTSQAAPHVSGTIALMFQAARDLCNPPKALNISQIRQILIVTADRNPPPGINGQHDLRYGYGRLNCERAVNQVLT